MFLALKKDQFLNLMAMVSRPLLLDGCLPLMMLPIPQCTIESFLCGIASAIGKQCFQTEAFHATQFRTMTYFSAMPLKWSYVIIKIWSIRIQSTMR